MNRMSGGALKRAALGANDIVATMGGFNPALARPAAPPTPQPAPPKPKPRPKRELHRHARR
jgi:hypothetical protein